MTSQRLNRLLVLVTAFIAGATAAGCQIEPGAAGQPTYEADVRPILMARCIRCHGSPPLGDPTSVVPAPPNQLVRFDVYGESTCADGGGVCATHGALYEAMMHYFSAYLNKPRRDVLSMPPAPAPPLTSYQKDTIINWENEATPLEK